MGISSALTALESLSSSTSTSSSGPLNTLINQHFCRAKERIIAGEEPVAVIRELQKQVLKSKKEVEKGLKAWYSALGNVGKAVDKTFPPALSAISKAYENPALFVDEDASTALDKAVLDSLGRRGLWDAVAALEKETGLEFSPEKRALSEELQGLITAMRFDDFAPALAWCESNKSFLESPPHPSALPFYLHRAVLLSIADPAKAIIYARKHMMVYLPTQPVIKLITSRLYSNGNAKPETADVDMEDDTPKVKKPKMEEDDALDVEGLIAMFSYEFRRRHQWPKEDPLEVAADLGSRGGALNVIEKARRVIGEHLGHVREWTDLPMEVPLPASRRYHSVFVCPVSKEQATESNPPMMLGCGHVIASESLDKMMKGGHRDVKCSYCPFEASKKSAQRLYF